MKKLEAEGVVETVNPAEPIDCILNITISEKKTLGSIRMNIDARTYNKEPSTPGTTSRHPRRPGTS